ncbi:MAG: TnpV protein [Lachnospiraceae bacterium]|nr:TnpV protein [Lachnospiraceae bacterium]
MEALAYRKCGEYLIPDLELDGEKEMGETPLGKYGMLRQSFLMEHHRGTYTSMLLTGRLLPHLRETDRQAREQVERTVAWLMEKNGVDEALKEKGQMAWAQAVNNFTAQAEELALQEIVYG